MVEPVLYVLDVILESSLLMCMPMYKLDTEQRILLSDRYVLTATIHLNATFH